MDMQEKINMMMKAMTADRKNFAARNGQYALGQLISKLEQFNPSALLKFSDGTSPAYFGSYRGYYEDLYIDRGPDITVSAFLARANDVLNTELTGYKGGEFFMDSLTLIWVSEYGSSSDVGITNIKLVGSEVIIDITEMPEFQV